MKHVTVQCSNEYARWVPRKHSQASEIIGEGVSRLLGQAECSEVSSGYIDKEDREGCSKAEKTPWAKMWRCNIVCYVQETLSCV